MGIEYRVTAASGEWPMSKQETTEWITRVCSTGRLRGTSSSKGRFEFRLTDADSDWPDVVLDIEDNGLYICTYGGRETNAIIGGLVSELASKFSEPGFTLVEL